MVDPLLEVSLDCDRAIAQLVLMPDATKRSYPELSSIDTSIQITFTLFVLITQFTTALSDAFPESIKRTDATPVSAQQSAKWADWLRSGYGQRESGSWGLR